MSFLKELFNSIARTLGRIIAYALIGFLIFFVFGKLTNAASYSSYIWEEPSYIQFKNSANTTLQQCNNSDVCFYTGGNDAVGAYINYSVSSIDTPPMVQKSYKVSIEFTLTSLNATSISTSSSAHSMQMQVRNSTSGAYTSATCDGSASLTITKQDSATTRVKYNCSKLNVSSTVYVMAMNYKYTPPSGYALPYWTMITMEQNLAVVDLNDPNQSIIDSQIASANSIITNNDQNTEKILEELKKNNQALVDKQNQTNNKLDDINDALTDSSVPDVDNVPTFNFNNGPVSGLLTMPITWFNAFVNPGRCEDISLGELMGTELKFECINPEEYLGEDIWSTIDIFIVVMMVISICSMILHIVESFRNLNDMYDEYYTPQHQGYQTKHNWERV